MPDPSYRLLVDGSRGIRETRIRPCLAARTAPSPTFAVPDECECRRQRTNIRLTVSVPTMRAMVHADVTVMVKNTGGACLSSRVRIRTIGVRRFGRTIELACSAAERAVQGSEYVLRLGSSRQYVGYDGSVDSRWREWPLIPTFSVPLDCKCGHGLRIHE